MTQTHAYILLVSMQFSVVVFLAIASREAAKGFGGERALSILSVAWLANFLYLLLASGSFELLQADALRNSDQVVDLLASVLFWRAAIVGIPKTNRTLFTRISQVGLFLVLILSSAWYVSANMFLNQALHRDYVVTVLPVVIVAMISRFSLGQYFRFLETRVAEVSSRHRVLSSGAFLYTGIQPLHFLGTKGADTAGFALGFLSKLLLYFGLLRLLVDYASAYARSREQQEALARQQRALRSVGHELGTPVSEILYYSPELAGIIPHRGIAASLLASIENAALRMAAILDASSLINLEELASISRQHVPGLASTRAPRGSTARLTDRQVISANTLVQIAVMALKATRSENVKFKHGYSRGCCLKCRPGEIVQVIVNLLRNAYDSLPDAEGIIEVKTENVKSDVTAEGKSVVRITIQDNGEGISPDSRALIFDTGFSTRGGANRGQGLPIARALVQGNGGDIALVSPVDTKDQRRPGTKVTLAFPRTACDQK